MVCDDLRRYRRAGTETSHIDVLARCICVADVSQMSATIGPHIGGRHVQCSLAQICASQRAERIRYSPFPQAVLLVVRAGRI